MPWTIIGNLVITLLPRLIRLMEKKTPESGQGSTKKSAVKEIIMASVAAIETVVGRDILNDPEVSKAYDAVNDAIVAFQNIVAKKVAETPVKE